MSLRPHEQQALGQIERALCACDPKLAGMLSIFTRLTAHEGMPPQEGPLTVPAAQNMARRSAASRPGGMSLIIVGMLIILLVLVSLVLSGTWPPRASVAPRSVGCARVSACQPGDPASQSPSG